MNNSIIEQLGVNAVTTYLCTSGYISPQIDKNDKTPMWDGFLYVYKTADHFNNDNFSYRVPVQVKASECKDIPFPNQTTYSIPITNLKSYHNDGGAVFFKVLTRNQDSEIYVSFLTKEKIEKLLSDTKTIKQKTVTINLEKKPESVDDLLANLKRIHLQKNHPLIDFSSINGKKNVTIKFSTKKPTEDVDLLAYWASRPVDVLLSFDDLPCNFIAKGGPVRLKFIATSHSKISIKGKTYYTEFKREYDDNETRIYVGKSCVIEIDNQEESYSVKFSFTFKPSTIEENISELEFLLAVMKYKQICFDSFILDLEKFENKDDIINTWKTSLRFWQDVKKLFKTLNLPLDVNFKIFSTQEEEDLNILINALLYNKMTEGQIKETSFVDFNVKNLIIRVAALKIDDNSMQLYDINSLCKKRLISTHPKRGYPFTFSLALS